jgi:hypothetical protein
MTIVLGGISQLFLPPTLYLLLYTSTSPTGQDAANKAFPQTDPLVNGPSRIFDDVAMTMVPQACTYLPHTSTTEDFGGHLSA